MTSVNGSMKVLLTRGLERGRNVAINLRSTTKRVNKDLSKLPVEFILWQAV